MSVTASALTPITEFELLREQRIEALNISLAEYRHPATGARHFHINAKDDNNVFMVAFPTVPQDSTGVAHILEHTALCGSERYPVRDPFFMMLRRSLNTFMNAFTGSDYTAYPFATCNRKDFDNLLNIYLDAAFFPLLNELDFAQEGHRLEFEQPDDPSTPLVYRGVVYNEMKGAMSAPVARLWQTLQSSIYPTTTYHFNSGGEPAVIPQLTHEQLRHFHACHYHPSNAVFLTYGTIPASEHQQRFQTLALARFERLNETIRNRDEQRYAEPQTVVDTYALDPGEETAARTHIVVGWLLDHSVDTDALMEAALLSGVLLDNSSSPLRHLLETTSLGQAPSELCGVEDSFREMLFVCGIEGSEPESAEAFQQAVIEVLEQVARDGVAPEQLEAVVQQIELEQRQARAGEPYGLQLMGRVLPAAIHGGDPFAMLDLDPALERLRQRIRDPQLIPGLIRRLLLDNPHRVLLTLKPDTEQSAREQEQVRAALAQRKSELDPEQAQQLVERAARLQQRQQQVDDLSVLPRVGLDDVPADIHTPPYITGKAGELPLTRYAVGSNGLVHQQFVLPLPAFADEYLDVLPLYADFLTELGCAGEDYLSAQARESRTGSIESSIVIRAAVEDTSVLHGWFTVSGLGLARQHSALNSLLSDHLFKPRLDERNRLRELLAQASAMSEGNVTATGHTLAMTAAAANLSPAASLSHRWHGLLGIRLLKKITRAVADEAAMDELLQQMQGIHQQLLATPLEVLLVAEDESLSAMVDTLGQTLPGAAGAGGSLFNPPEPDASRLRQGWAVNTQVNFCASVFPAVPVQHRDAASLMVLGRILTNGYLHGAIREQGGAYGGGASYDPDAGAMRFFSYRDPRLEDTFIDFERSIAWLQAGSVDGRQLEEAILGVIGAMDRPEPPVATAIRDFHQRLQGRGPQNRRQLRQRILEVSLDDLQQVARRYLRPDTDHRAVISDSGTLERLSASGWSIESLQSD